MALILPTDPNLRGQRSQIVRDFYRAFDLSWMERQIRDLDRLPPQPLGEGRHFRSYRVISGKSLDLALNVAKRSFGEGQSATRRLWCQAIRQLQSLSHPLLPPIEVIPLQDDGIAYVMPYCEQEVPMASLRQEAFRTWLAEWERELEGLGLWMDDYWQLRLCRGHPFVIDFSELKPLPLRKWGAP